MIRDYIPSGDKLTVTEEQKLRGRSRRENEGVVPDFIPERPMAETPPYMDRVKAAQKRLIKAAAKSRQEVYVRAVTKLSKMDAKATVAFIETLPSVEREVFLLAEENHAGRKTVLNAFPPIGDSVRRRYAQDEQEIVDAD